MIDLHMHSTYSNDGEFTPLQLAEKCAERGIRVMSVTDHNTVKASEAAMSAAEKMGITYIPGIEIDCVYEDTNFHVLGYGIDFGSGDFKRIEQNVRSQSLRASREMFDKTRELGFLVTEEELRSLADGSFWPEAWTGEMFAEILLGKPEYADHPALRPYRPGGARGDNPYVNFYWDYYSQGKPCYAEINFPSMAEIIGIIHENGGAAVLAHPGVNLKDKEFLLDGIVGLGLDGIEAFSSYHTAEQAERYCREARERRLAVTCGSDYHGKTKPAIQIGGHRCTVPCDTVRAQLEEMLRVRRGTA